MAGELNIGSSVLKRESAPFDEVMEKLRRDGWSKTGELAQGRVVYVESSGISLTVVDGPMGTLIFPSGPVRGKLFSSDSVGVGLTSTIGLGQPAPERNPRNQELEGQMI